jgi:hypothetical protein
VVATVGERSLNISRQRVGHGKKVTLVLGNKLTTYKKDTLNTYLRYFSLSSSALHVKLKTQSLSNSWVVQSSDLDAAFGLKEHISGSQPAALPHRPNPSMWKQTSLCVYFLCLIRTAIRI